MALVAKQTRIILCLTEGRKPDKSILLKALEHFFNAENTDVKFLGLNIYQLYRNIKDYSVDNELTVDTFAILQEISLQMKNGDTNVLQEYSREEIAEIFLFYDYDGHATEAQTTTDLGVSQIKEMLNYFSDETENGKLYINYPMIESFRHPIKKDKELVDINMGSTYKNWTTENCDKLLKGNFSKISKIDWLSIYSKHIKVANALITNEFKMISINADMSIYNQQNILKQQYLQHIKPHQQVAALCSIGLFLCEYFGVHLFKEY